jgi:adenylate cyclase
LPEPAFESLQKIAPAPPGPYDRQQKREEVPLAREQRKLAAILAADVVGYSRLMGRDESGTLARLHEHRRGRLEPSLARYGGRLVKLTGDGALAEFPSAVDALSAAIEFQQAMAKANREQPRDTALVFRIGLHLGDLIVEGDDLYGDGVNIAARLEAEAPPGGIIVSRAVREAVEGRLRAKLHALGELSLRNVERPMRAFRVEWDEADWQAAATSPARHSEPDAPTLALPDKPSIAVLPFQNMSGDPEQEYFADGMVEEIITVLSRFKSLFVIARNSSFTYKGQAVDIKQVGRELGVRYVLEGSVRKAAGRLRITGQLVQADTGTHIWADRFDGDLADIFQLQDKVALDVVSTITSKLETAEMDRAKRKPTATLDAYDYLLRGMASAYRLTRQATSDALNLFYKAIELAPDFALAYSWAAICYMWRSGSGWMTDRSQETAEAVRMARRAIELDKDDALTLSWAGMTLTTLAVDFDYGATLLERALALNPNLMQAWFAIGWVRIWNSQPEPAIEAFAHAMRLSPLDHFSFTMQQGIAFGHFLAGRYDEASRFAEKSLWVYQDRPSGLRLMAASHALAGRLEEARNAMALARQLDPALRVSDIKNWIRFRRPDDLARYEEALRKAGLPE